MLRPKLADYFVSAELLEVHVRSFLGVPWGSPVGCGGLPGRLFRRQNIPPRCDRPAPRGRPARGAAPLTACPFPLLSRCIPASAWPARESLPQPAVILNRVCLPGAVRCRSESILRSPDCHECDWPDRLCDPPSIRIAASRAPLISRSSSSTAEPLTRMPPTIRSPATRALRMPRATTAIPPSRRARDASGRGARRSRRVPRRVLGRWNSEQRAST